MAESDTIQHQQALLATHRRTLAQQLEQRAKFGAGLVPPQIDHTIAEARTAIAQIKVDLRARGVAVDDEPGDKNHSDLSERRAQADAPMLGDQIGGDKVKGDKVAGNKNVYIGLAPALPPNPAQRRQRLEEAHRESRARCIRRWQAVDLSLDEAVFFADHPLSGIIDVQSYISKQRPLCILVGEIGVGKSLIAERYFQQAVQQALQTDHGPIPVYLSAQTIGRQLRAAVLNVAEGIGAPATYGATIIIDGADEIDAMTAGSILDEARELVHIWDKTTVLITSRPLPNFGHPTEQLFVEPPPEPQAQLLIQRVAGPAFDPRMMYGWPNQLKTAIRRPLFALLFATGLRAGTVRIDSIGGLLSALIEKALGEADANRRIAKSLLQRLAVFYIDRDGAPLVSDITKSPEEVQLLLATRLVHREGNQLRFTLTIFAEWFAALSLAEEHTTADRILTDPQRLDRWHYPLAMFVSSFHHDQVSRVLCPIAERYPAIAARVIRDALPQWGRVEGSILPDGQECGIRMRTAMESWVVGIGPLASLIAPIRADRTLLTLGIRAEGVHLTTSWYGGSKKLPDVVELPPPSVIFGKLDSGWNSVRSGYGLENSAWAWNLTLHELESELTPLIRQKTLPIDSGPIANEKLWRIGSAICQYKRKLIDPIPLTLFEDWLSKLSPHTVSASMSGYDIDPTWLRTQVTRLRASGNAEIHKPWPSHDRSLGQGGIWSLYSEEQQLVRARAVFDAALESYQQVIAFWFSHLASAMPIAVALPARLVGLFKPARAPGYDHHPSLTWWLEPLPVGSTSCIDIQFGERRIDDPRWEEGRTSRRAQLLSMRPGAVSWMGIGLYGYGADIFHDTAITELVYTWLKYDLQAAFWLR